MNNKLLKQIKKLSLKNKDYELEKTIIKHLKINPFDIDLLLRLALIQMYPPFIDEQKSIECINKVLQLDPSNINAILLLAYIEKHLGIMDTDILEKLSSYKSINNEILSMVELAKSWYYKQINDDIMYEKCLLKSIEFFAGHCKNYFNLGKFYIKHEKMTLGNKLISLSIDNVKKIFKKQDLEMQDTSDINSFLNEFYKGTYINNTIYEIMQENLTIY